MPPLTRESDYAIMLVTDFLQLVNDAYRGTDDVAPTVGTDDANYWLRTASRIKRNLYSDVARQWDSTYQVLPLGTISINAAPSFILPTSFLGAANDCYVIDANGVRTDFPLVQAQDASSKVQAAFIAGVVPQTLYFTKPVVSTDSYVGASLYLPAYAMPADIDGSLGSNTINVDDADWLVVATAAKLAFNDITYETKASDLQVEANAMYKQMLAANRRGTAGNPRKSRYNVTRIGQRHATRNI